jgi:hypothetical protein
VPPNLLLVGDCLKKHRVVMTEELVEQGTKSMVGSVNHCCIPAVKTYFTGWMSLSHMLQRWNVAKATLHGRGVAPH